MTTIEQAQNHPMWNHQMDLEGEMASLGIKRFRDKVQSAKDNSQETRIGAVRKLLGSNHSVMVEGIQEFYREVETKGAGPKHRAYGYLKAISDDDVVAHLAMRVILNSVSLSKGLSHVAVEIAEALEDECNYRIFKEQQPHAYLKAAKRAKEATNTRYQRSTVKRAAKAVSVELLAWTKPDKILLGSKLVEIFAEKTNLIQLDRRHDRVTVEIVPAAREWLEEEMRRAEWLTPMYLPMVVPPRPWTSPFEGGYWTRQARRLTLIKTPNRAYLEELEDREMPEVYTAINALQNTGWCVNTKILEVMETLWENRSTCGMIPLVENEEMPVKPMWLVPGMTKEDMTPEQHTEFVGWKSECIRVHGDNAAMVGQRLSFSRMLWVANKFKQQEFFYPHQLDWRGRAYPIGMYLQPQGNDPQRGLLEFSTTCPINTQEAADWLAIHGAGLWGVDKVSMEERVRWVYDNEAAILASAANPYDNRFWMDADKPWCALAFAFDWAGFRAHGFGYESALPVQMDGTCNGLQNFSALLLDPIGGAAVNLVPADKPQDIYQRVADIVAKRVEEDAKAGHEYAPGWVGNVTRKVAKRPVMTLAYGAKRFGFTDMIFEDTIKPWKAEKPEAYPFGHHGFQAALYLAGLIWDAVGEVVVAARQAMDWLQEAARVVSSEDLPINWTTPTGLLVQQHYKLRDMRKVKLSFQDVVIEVRADAGTDKTDKRKQASGISPNWIHSLDASHLMRTICACTYAGMETFSMIHDSYGTHAGNCGALATILREEFVRQYSETCVITGFRDDLQAMLPDGTELPPLPPKGDLDLSLVNDSQFFFA